MAMMMADVMEALGIARGDYVIRVNNRKVLDGVLEAAGVIESSKKLIVLRTIDKFDKFGWEGVKLLLGAGRKDESGDFTKGAQLSESQIERVMSFFGAASMSDLDHVFDPNAPELADMDVTVIKGDAYVLRNRDQTKYFRHQFGDSPIAVQGLDELDQIADLVEAAGYGTKRIRIDPSIVRGLEYYTGPVYEAELTFPVVNEDGERVSFGSVGGGGRYDGLVSRFRGEPVPATGFSIGVSRLTAALKALGKLDMSDVLAPVVVLVMDKDTASLGRYQKMVSELRKAGIRAEMYLGGAGMKAQIKYADRRGSPAVVIQGGNERAEGVVQIKDLIEGARQAAAIAGHAEYKEARPGQVTVPEGDLVAEVKKILDAQAAERGRGR